VRTGKIVIPPTTLSHLLDPTGHSTLKQSYEITKLDVRPNGTAVVITSQPAAYALSPSLQAWSSLITPHYLASPLPNPQRGPLADVEAGVRAAWKGKAEVDKPEWWDTSLHLQQAQGRVKGAQILGSGEEWKFWVEQLGDTLGKEGFVERARELIESLMGPKYPYVNAFCSIQYG
jgi:protein HIRA/HIR1